MSEIKIRNVPNDVITKIDELAKKKKESRNIYLKNVIENYALDDKVSSLDEKYTQLFEKVEYILVENTKAVNSLINRIIELESRLGIWKKCINSDSIMILFHT